MSTIKTKKTLTQRDSDSHVSAWRFRREITLGTVVHIGAILIMLVAGWSNLQKELALIRHDLNQLIRSSVQLREHVEKVAEKQLEYEYRLKKLEDS